MYKILLLISLLLLTASCSVMLSTNTDTDLDDLYVRQGRVYTSTWNYRNQYYAPSVYDWYRDSWWYSGPNVIVIQPKVETPNYGKRPSRSGGSTTPSPYNKRGRQ